MFSTYHTIIICVKDDKTSSVVAMHPTGNKEYIYTPLICVKDDKTSSVVGMHPTGNKEYIYTLLT